MFFKKYFSKLVIAFLLAACIFYGRNLDGWGRNTIIASDVVSYYAYLPAGLIFHDLTFSFYKDLPPDFDGKIWLEKTPNGKAILRMTMGLAILWSPFFIVAHLFAKASGISALGYSWPYSLSIFAAAIFYLFIGLFYIRKILLKYFSDFITGLTLLLIVLGTNLMYYVISEPGMSHNFNFSLIAMFLYFTLKWVDKSTVGTSIILGILAGLIVLIRPINGLVLVFPALIGITSWADFRQRLMDRWQLILLAGLTSILVVLPQLIYWKVQTGHFFFNSYMDSGRFFWRDPHIIDGLFSYRKGWLIYTPVMIFALPGLYLMRRYNKMLFMPLIVFLVLFLYVIFSWWCWWYGGSYGSRPMVDVYGLLAFPLAAFLAYIFNHRWWSKAIISTVLLFFIVLNQFQMTQSRTSLLHFDSMTKQAYWGIFFKKTWPPGYDQMIKVPDYEKALKYGEE